MTEQSEKGGKGRPNLWHHGLAGSTQLGGDDVAQPDIVRHHTRFVRLRAGPGPRGLGQSR